MVFETQSRAKATIARRTIEVESTVFDWNNDPVTIDLASGFGGSATVSIAGAGANGQYIAHSGAGSGYNWTSNISIYGTGQGLTIGNLTPNNMITFHDKEEKTVLVITADGDVEWHGKPSEAAEAMKRTFQFAVEDMKGVTKAARRRYYLRACQNILNKAESMEHEEFVAFLQKQVYNKERRVIMDGLRGEEDAG